jgi:hypothetical protein
LTEATASAEAGNAATATTTAEAGAATTAAATTTSWRDSLPADLKTNTSLSKFETIEGLAKSYTNLETMLGTEKIPVPKEGDNEGWDRYYKAGGRPEKPDEYGFAKPEQLPEGMEYSPDIDKAFATKAHELGLNKKQAAALREWQLGIMSEGHKQQTSQTEIARSDGEAKLKSSWGRAYDQNLTIAKSELKKRATPEFVAYMETSGLGNHPAMAEFLYNVAKETRGEAELIGNGRTVEQTPLEIDAAISSHAKTHQAALFDSGHPEHALRTRERTALFERKFGGNG